MWGNYLECSTEGTTKIYRNKKEFNISNKIFERIEKIKKGLSNNGW